MTILSLLQQPEGKTLEYKQDLSSAKPQGTLLEAIDQSIKFIRRNTRLGAQIYSIKRVDIPQYPDMAIREVLINALAHADYSLGGCIQIAIFDDRLEIQNPGLLPFGLTIDHFKTGVSRIRNRVIVRIFRELGHMEEWGSGYSRCISYCREHSYPVPQWQEIGSTVRVFFYPHTLAESKKSIGQHGIPALSFDPVNDPDDPVNDPVNDPVKLDLNKRQSWFLNKLEQGEKLKSSDIIKQWKVHEKTAKRDIAYLIYHKLVRYTGSTRTGFYTIITKNS